MQLHTLASSTSIGMLGRKQLLPVTCLFGAVKL